MSSSTPPLRRAALGTVGLLLGAGTAFLEGLLVLVLAALRAIPAARPRIEALGRVVVTLNRRRLVTFLDYDDHLFVMPDWRLGYSYLARRSAIGVVGAVILTLICFGGTTSAVMAWQVIRGRPMGGESGDLSRDGNQWYEILFVAGIGFVLFFVAVWGLIGVAALDRSLADRYLRPSESEMLRRRLSRLVDTRAAMVDAINYERRRIERDLHDGVQQRMVALGLLLGRALRAKEPDHATELLRQAHEESRQVLNDLRDVTWRVYPTALDKDGLHAALEGVADRANVPVQLHYGLTARPDLATETVAYFVASEAVTNALKHGNATSIMITVSRQGNHLAMTVRDNGQGGADPTGSGLAGLASRVAAADGLFLLRSPEGGPTVVMTWLPISAESSELPALTPVAGRRF